MTSTWMSSLAWRLQSCAFCCRQAAGGRVRKWLATLLQLSAFGSATLCSATLLAQSTDCVPADNQSSSASILFSLDCYIEAARIDAGDRTLQLALSREMTADELVRFARLAERLALSTYGAGRRESALEQLNDSIDFLARSGRTDVAAPLFNSAGRFYAAAGEYLPAVASFADGTQAAAADLKLRVVAQLNMFRALRSLDEQALTPDLLLDVQEQIMQVGEDHRRARYLLLLGDLLETLPEPHIPQARQLYTRALAYLDQGSHSEELAYALGYLGRSTEDTQRATQLTRRALLVAQATGSSSLYLWEWQLAKLLLQAGLTAQALSMYDDALDSLDAIRSTFWTSGAGEFERLVKPLYYEVAENLLGAPGSVTTEDSLARARLVLDRAKLAEVENHFRDECADAASNAGEPASLEAGVGVLYPVVFSDRVELLLSTRAGMTRTTTLVASRVLSTTVDQLRLATQFLLPVEELIPLAQQVHGWLLAPVAAELEAQNIDTLVIVPDGALRGLPYAALHDGKQFLIEKLSFTLAPGLDLVDAQTSASEVNVVASGVSDAVLGFAPLPFVPEEIEGISKVYPVTANLNGNFNESSLAATIADRQHSVVHIATHARFSGSHEASYLLMHDRLLPMRQLEEIASARRYLDAPIDLLVLSACETAAGDERAALGLAGIAVQAGASSAIASLWQLSDEATAQLMSSFYSAWSASESSKAESLRAAQLHLLRGDRFSHPAYWSAFVLIGSWR